MSVNKSDHKPLRVLIVDDSAINRSSMAVGFAASGEVEVVGTASDGSEALRLVRTLKPDVITLDLEMPKMDGFSFLRLLMSTQPTPVIVVSSYSRKENVFRALELGAVDFVAKPEGDPGQIDKIRDLLLQKLLLVRNLKQGQLSLRPAPIVPSTRDSNQDITSEPPVTPPRFIVAIASSTGGPTAVTEILSKLSAKRSYAVLIAQHMPEKFTRTFAQRLDRYSALRVAEASDGDLVTQGTAFVCPGRYCMELETAPGGQFRLRTRVPAPEDRYIPSATRLFASVARAIGGRTIGVVLTGMGDDGVEGAREIFGAGGTVLAESEETAVVYGMPRAAVRAGVVTRSLPLYRIADQLMDLVR